VDTSTVVDLHGRATRDFAAMAANVEPRQWHDPTPCTEWDVRTLVNHVVGEDLWTVPLMEGRTIEEVGDRFDGDLLGDDPASTCQAAADAAIEAVSEPGALDRTVHLSFGETAADEYVWQLFADHLIHRWDLAVAIGGETRLDPELVAACATWFAHNEGAFRAAGVIAPRPTDVDVSDPQAALLAGFGRSSVVPS
jgi:uncharacterized protein (TIGR03086 family)